MTVHLLSLRTSRRGALVAGLTTLGALGIAIASARRRREHHAELKDLREGDCPTPGCTREARGTGYMELEEGRCQHIQCERCRGDWYIEFKCPRCGEVFTVWTPELQELAEKLADRRRGCG